MHIRNPRTIRALASPVRLAILDALDAIGPAPAADVAAIVGLNADAVYYHLRMLQRLGLVASRSKGNAAVFNVVSRPLTLAYSRDKATVSAVSKVVAAMLRAALRLFTRALAGTATIKGPRREIWAAQRFARLTPDHLQRLNRLLNEVVDLLGNARHHGPGKLYAVTFVLAPLGQGQKGRTPQRPEESKVSRR